MLELNRPASHLSNAAAVFRSHRELVLEDHWLPAIEMMVAGCDPMDPQLQEHTRIVNVGREAYSDTLAAIAPKEWWDYEMARASARFGNSEPTEATQMFIGPYPRCQPNYDPGLTVAMRVGITLGIIDSIRKTWSHA